MARSVFLGMMIVAGMIAIAPSVYAQELMNLYPSARTAYQEKFDQTAQRYESRGRDYINHMYSTGGETDMYPMEDLETDILSVNPEDVARYVSQSNVFDEPTLRQ